MKINIKYDKEVDVYVSHCPIFNLYSQGRTIEEAKEAICEAIYLLVDVSFKEGVLEKSLKIKYEVREEK